jgi:hypothetical protein
MKEKTWLTNGEKGCLFRVKKVLMMTMGKSYFYMEFWSNLLKLWKMKDMMTTRWCEMKICLERRSWAWTHVFKLFCSFTNVHNDELFKCWYRMNHKKFMIFLQTICDYGSFILQIRNYTKTIWVVLDPKMHNHISHQVYQHQPCPIMLVLTPT